MRLRTTLAAALCLLAAAAPLTAQVDYDAHFTDRTMRVDYYQTGGLGQQIVSLDRVVSDGPWPGSRTQLIDGTGLGVYRFEVRDAATNALLFSRGFASTFGEWLTTAEAGRVHRTFHESLRFPWPRRPVTVLLQRRGEPQGTRTGEFETVWTTTVDPESRFVNRADLEPAGRVITFQEHGAPATKVDLLLVAEGYTEDQQPKFEADARRLLEALFREEPFRSRRTDFNVRGLFIPAAEPGGHRTRAGVHRRSPTQTEYNIFDSERYILTQDNRTLRDIASAAPYEFIEVLVNDAQYGGGGIFNDHSTVAVDSEFAEYVFVHEFGHHFAGLADEYYTSDVAYQTGAPVKPEPWERNATALHDPATLKWRHHVTAGTPLPTPWDKQEYERHGAEIRARRQALVAQNAPQAEFDRLFAEQQAWETAFMQRQRYAGRVGAFEGASYEAEGLYRPEIDCIMFSRNPVGFCDVCREAISEIIDLYTS